MVTKISSRPCGICAASYTYDTGRLPSMGICPTCCTDDRIMRSWLEDAKDCVFVIEKERHYPQYYLFFNNNVAPVGTVIAYRMLQGIRMGRVVTQFLPNEFAWVRPIDRATGLILSKNDDEVRWTDILAILKCK